MLDEVWANKPHSKASSRFWHPEMCQDRCPVTALELVLWPGRNRGRELPWISFCFSVTFFFCTLFQASITYILADPHKEGVCSVLQDSVWSTASMQPSAQERWSCWSRSWGGHEDAQTSPSYEERLKELDLSGDENAPGTPHCSLPVLKGSKENRFFTRSDSDMTRWGLGGRGLVFN